MNIATVTTEGVVVSGDVVGVGEKQWDCGKEEIWRQ